MAQSNRGLYRLVSASWAYSLYQSLVGARAFRRRFVTDHVRPRPTDRVLDIGCGTAEILDSLPGVPYVGIDASAAYVRSAREHYGNRGTFHVADVQTMRSALASQFDIVLAMGLLHHLDDDDALQLFDTSYDLLADHGRLITIDGAFAPGQNPLARWLIRRDRGKNIRGEAELLALARRRFPAAQAQVRTDLLRIPYTHAILECPKLP